jgi:hypothetical protein
MPYLVLIALYGLGKAVQVMTGHGNDRWWPLPFGGVYEQMHNAQYGGDFPGLDKPWTPDVSKPGGNSGEGSWWDSILSGLRSLLASFMPYLILVLLILWLARKK